MMSNRFDIMISDPLHASPCLFHIPPSNLPPLTLFCFRWPVSLWAFSAPFCALIQEKTDVQHALLLLSVCIPLLFFVTFTVLFLSSFHFPPPYLLLSLTIEASLCTQICIMCKSVCTHIVTTANTSNSERDIVQLMCQILVSLFLWVPVAINLTFYSHD